MQTLSAEVDSFHLPFVESLLKLLYELHNESVCSPNLITVDGPLVEYADCHHKLAKRLPIILRKNVVEQSWTESIYIEKVLLSFVIA